MKKYYELRKEVQEELDKFFEEKGFFAFNNEQLKKGLEKVKATKENKVTNLGAGAFILSSELDNYKNIDEGLDRKVKDYIFSNYVQAFDAFCYELNNHEYCVTWDEGPALDALGLEIREIEEKPEILKAWKKAKSACSREH